MILRLLCPSHTCAVPARVPIERRRNAPASGFPQVGGERSSAAENPPICLAPERATGGWLLPRGIGKRNEDRPVTATLMAQSTRCDLLPKSAVGPVRRPIASRRSCSRIRAARRPRRGS